MPFIVSAERYEDKAIVVPIFVRPPHAFVNNVLLPSKLHEKNTSTDTIGLPQSIKLIILKNDYLLTD